MARTGNASTGLIRTASTVTAPTRWSFHMWYRNASAPQSSGYQAPIAFGSADFNYDAEFVWRHNATYYKSVYQRTSGGAFPAAQLTSTLVANTWYAIGGSYDGTNLKAWLNGTNEASTPSGDPATTSDPTLSVLGTFNGSGTGFDDGTVAESAFWNVALTDGEFKMLAAGVAPSYVRPASLLTYWPVVGASPEPDWSGNGRNGTVSGTTTVADPPPVRPLTGGELWLPYVVPILTQVAVPISDSSTGAWHDTPLYPKIGETVRDDATFIVGGAGVSGDKFRVKLASLIDPGGSTGHVLRYAYRKYSAGTGRVDLIVRLIQGASTVIASQTHMDIPAATTDGTLTLSGAEADSITAYDDLYAEGEQTWP